MAATLGTAGQRPRAALHGPRREEAATRPLLVTEDRTTTTKATGVTMVERLLHSCRRSQLRLMARAREQPSADAAPTAVVHTAQDDSCTSVVCTRWRCHFQWLHTCDLLGT